jgi:sulfite exporter TauE/SafE
LLYPLSKALGYGLIGVLVGSFGKVFTLFNWQQNLSILAGVVLLLITILPYLKENLLPNKLSTNIVSKIYSNFSQKHPFLFFTLLGFANALLPCGLIYTALAGAIITYSAWNGFVFMFLFGVGTMPVLLGLIMFKSKMNIAFRNKLKSKSKSKV